MKAIVDIHAMPDFKYQAALETSGKTIAVEQKLEAAAVSDQKCSNVNERPR